ncbi:iron complex transport system permease protein [Croceifilum oryzae]|uniref:Iron complex transport system permease protein n=1 Tax=Croceifilum oryzae TaxID=1553429 RepID=A0AAJ1WRB3_9BACL|nr:iron ABC transporter permease [Croceifilum oryzae]MDQ0416138.1 iron complex transport system permease protein [Croceifilum oryzae]
MRRKYNKKHVYIGGGMFLCFLFTFILAVTVGSLKIPISEIWNVIGHHTIGFPNQVDPTLDAVLWSLRFPRVVLAMVVGASLALAGVLYQGVLRNPLADPYILGVSSGSATGAIIAILSGIGAGIWGMWFISLSAFIGAFIATVSVFLLAGRELRTNTLILAGVVIHALFGAIITFLLSMSVEQMSRIQYWLMGSFSLREWTHIWILIPVILVVMAVAWFTQRELNLFAVNARTAAHVGVSVKKTRFLLLILASLLTAMVVSISGVIGFVGIVIPHLIRMIIGANHRFLIPYSILAGATFMMASDLLARTIFDPRELPVGVITAFLGAPFFSYFLYKWRRNL